jgi:uncharacterized protein YndB with AHSA1/START domain
VKTHTATCSMIIRRPVAEVFHAFVDPTMITRFWLEATTGPLARGAQVTWRFLVPGATETVTVTALEDQRRLAFDWSDGIHVDMGFAPFGQDGTRVVVEATGFQGKAAEASVIGATEGFTIVLCDLKTLLETGRSAGLVKDKAELIVASSQIGAS